MKRIIYKNENILNLPNLLSFYRLVISPLILYLALSQQEKLFIIFLIISLISDILDGNIARIFKLQTKFGATLDNVADMFTYVLAFLGIFIFKSKEVQPHAWIFFVFLSVLLLSYVIAFLRFRKIPGLHLYLAVSSGYAQGVFIFILFVFGFFPWMFYLVAIWGTIAYLEKIIILMLLDDIKPGVKGLYWLLKKPKEMEER